MLVIDVSDFALEMFGPEPEAKIGKLIEAEAERLWHIRRSKPRTAQKVQEELGSKLLHMFTMKKVQLGGLLTQALQEERERVLEAIEKQDHTALETMWKEQVWTKK